MRIHPRSAARSEWTERRSSASSESIGLWRASRRALAGALLTGLVALGLCSAISAQDPATPITRVEEDWELVIDIPEPDGEAPQITTVISPYGDLDWTYGVFEINHATQPSYSTGGMQLQVWQGDDFYASKRQYSGVLLRVANEPITWTASMSLADYWLRFQVSSGSSQTWGQFGQDTTLRKGIGTWLTNLNHYSPTVSVEGSRVGFASNRVKKLTLKRVRYYSGATLVSTDSTERVAFAPNDLVESAD